MVITREILFLLIAIITAIIIFFIVGFEKVIINDLEIPNILRIPSIQIPWVVLIPGFIFIIGIINPLSLFPDEIDFNFSSKAST